MVQSGLGPHLSLPLPAAHPGYLCNLLTGGHLLIHWRASGFEGTTNKTMKRFSVKPKLKLGKGKDDEPSPSSASANVGANAANIRAEYYAARSNSNNHNGANPFGDSSDEDEPATNPFGERAPPSRTNDTKANPFDDSDSDDGGDDPLAGFGRKKPSTAPRRHRQAGRIEASAGPATDGRGHKCGEQPLRERRQPHPRRPETHPEEGRQSVRGGGRRGGGRDSVRGAE